MNESIPVPYKEKFIEIFNKIHEKKNVFDTLKVVQNNFEKIYSRMEAIWSKSVSFDGKTYIDYANESSKPPRLSNRRRDDILPSDSRYRKDIQLRAEVKLEESQEEKERIEQEERRLRKLRESNKI